MELEVGQIPISLIYNTRRGQPFFGAYGTNVAGWACLSVAKLYSFILHPFKVQCRSHLMHAARDEINRGTHSAARCVVLLFAEDQNHVKDRLNDSMS